MLVVETTKCRLYELYRTRLINGGASWSASSFAKFDLNSNALRPAGWTSADTAGLPIFPGLVRWEEVAAGEIAHAIRFTAARIWGRDAAILTTLAPGAHTAIVEEVGGATGLAIVEVFEVDLPQVPLINIATRGLVESGANVLIAGFVIQGDAPKKVLVTARGQSVAVLPSEIPLLMKNPMLQLFSGATPIATNDDWQTPIAPPSGSPVVLLPSTDIPATQKPADVKDAAILTTLAPGAYTAIVTDSTPGIAIVEVFAQ